MPRPSTTLMSISRSLLSMTRYATHTYTLTLTPRHRLLAILIRRVQGQVSATPLVASANPDGAESLWLQHDGGHLSLRVSFVATTRRPVCIVPLDTRFSLSHIHSLLLPYVVASHGIVPSLRTRTRRGASAFLALDSSCAGGTNQSQHDHDHDDEDIDNHRSSLQPCEAITPPQELDIQSEEAHQYALCQYPFAPATRTTVAELTFQLAVTSLFYADLGYAFAFGHVRQLLLHKMARLVGANILCCVAHFRRPR